LRDEKINRKKLGLADPFTLLYHSNEKSARSQTRNGTAFPTQRPSLLHQPQQKHPSEVRKRQSTRPRRAACSFGTGDEGIKEPYPSSPQRSRILLCLDHPIKPLHAQRRI
jgi:hypothetical protein